MKRIPKLELSRNSIITLSGDMLRNLHESNIYCIGKCDTSANFKTAAGVLQGGVISELLFKIFIADMPLPPAHPQLIKRLKFANNTLSIEKYVQTPINLSSIYPWET